jgi:hypothetical protein
MTARDLPEQGLYHWLGEGTMRRNYNLEEDWLAPDGWGSYLTSDREIPFNLEWDRGTTYAKALQDKVDLYAEVCKTGEHALFVLPGAGREGTLQTLAGRLTAGQRERVTFWTTTAPLLRQLGPLGTIWRPVGDGERVSLADLEGDVRGERRTEDCIGKPEWWLRRPGGTEGA